MGVAYAMLCRGRRSASRSQYQNIVTVHVRALGLGFVLGGGRKGQGAFFYFICRRLCARVCAFWFGRSFWFWCVLCHIAYRRAEAPAALVWRVLCL